MTSTALESIAYDENIPEEDRLVLESRAAVFRSAVLSTAKLKWSFVEDYKGRKYYQLRKYSDPRQCYAELTINEIAEWDDADIKRTIILNERPCIDIDARIRQWVTRLNDLYDNIESWLPHRSVWQSTRSETLQVEEELMKLRRVKPRSVPTLDLRRQDRFVSFRPNALFVVGANGRVDVTTSSRQYLLVDLAPDAVDSRDWRIAVPNHRQLTVPFDKNQFDSLLKDA